MPVDGDTRVVIGLPRQRGGAQSCEEARKAASAVTGAAKARKVEVAELGK